MTLSPFAFRGKVYLTQEVSFKVYVRVLHARGLAVDSRSKIQEMDAEPASRNDLYLQ